MSLKAFQAFTACWYTQAQAQGQAQVGQGQFTVPPMAPLVTPPAQPTLKLSKLVNEARQLGCEAFSNIIDAVMAKNCLKRVLDTLTNMELDELKLKVATRVMDKSVTT